MARGTGSGKTPKRVIELLREEVEKTSQSAVSRGTGIGIPTIHRYLKGIGEPSHDIMQKLAIYFERPVEWLRGEQITGLFGESYGDNLSEEEIEELNELFWVNRVEHAAQSPLLIEVVKCITKISNPDARKVAYAIIKNSCNYIGSLTEDELIKAGDGMFKRQLESHKCQNDVLQDKT